MFLLPETGSGGDVTPEVFINRFHPLALLL
jgi:hypothetical protein